MKFAPSTFRAILPSPMGPMVAAASDQGLCGLWFDGQRHQPDTGRWEVAAEHPILRRTAAAMQAYYDGASLPFDLPLDLHGGTEFQQAVWQGLLRIPRGQTISYAALSERIGKPGAIRAVGTAVGRNPITVIVPCHRVIGTNGSLTGYAGGLDRKAALLRLELAEPAQGGLWS